MSLHLLLEAAQFLEQQEISNAKDEGPKRESVQSKGNEIVTHNNGKAARAENDHHHRVLSNVGILPPFATTGAALSLVPYDEKPILDPVEEHEEFIESGKGSSPFDESYSTEELKRRSGNTPSREVHNKLEKNRRAHLKECFETLRRQLPSMEDKKISNQTILKAAYRYIGTLKRREKEYEHEMERLARQKIAYQQRLATLKKDVSSRWDHIDFSKTMTPADEDDDDERQDKESTSTASEGADFEDDTKEGQSSYLDQPLNLSTSNVFAPLKLSPRSPPHPPPLVPTFIQKRTNSCSPPPIVSSATTSAKSRMNGEWRRSAAQHNNMNHYRLMTTPQTRNSSLENITTTISNIIKEESFSSSTILAAMPRKMNSNINCQLGGSNSIPLSNNTAKVSSDQASMAPLNGIRVPATGATQLVAGNVHLSRQPGGAIIGQQAIQVITPDGYKILPAEHAHSGTKQLAITLAHPSRLDQMSEDRKVMFAVNKNGLQTLQLAVPNRTVIQGPPVPVTNPLGATVNTNVKVTQATSLIPSYLPVTNGLTQVVSLVGPIPVVVSQAPRGVMVPSGSAKTTTALPVVVVSASNHQRV